MWSKTEQLRALEAEAGRRVAREHLAYPHIPREAPRMGRVSRLLADNERVDSRGDRLADRPRPGAVTGDLLDVADFSSG